MDKTSCIGIDCRFAALPTGLGRYSRELVTHLTKLDNPIEYILFTRSTNEEWLKQIPAGVKIIVADFPHYSFSEQLKFPQIIAQSKIDLLFSPHFNVPLSCPVPFVVTIHDLILHRFPNSAPLLKRIAYRFLMRRAVYKAKAIIAVSAFTASELSLTYGKNIAGKTIAITEGVNDVFKPQDEATQNEILKKFNLKKPFYLYVGNAKQHKNLPLLIESFTKANLPNTELVLVTGGKEAAHLKLAENIKLIDSVNDADLAALYSGAKAFVTPSLYEGYGLPIAEAQTCGCGVIAFSVSAIPETAGPEALLLPVNDKDALTSALINPPPPPINFKPSSWAQVATKTAEVLVATNKQ